MPTRNVVLTERQEELLETRMYSARTGQARLGYRPSKKSIKRMVEKIHALTDRTGTWQLRQVWPLPKCQ